VVVVTRIIHRGDQGGYGGTITLGLFAVILPLVMVRHNTEEHRLILLGVWLVVMAVLAVRFRTRRRRPPRYPGAV
jgi:uncharacterized membrane protein HdeD (DUF308 family)